MRFLLIVSFVISASGAAAHPGHMADLAGHDHWVAGAAIGLAILTGIYGALKGKKDTDRAEETAEDEDQVEAPA